MFVVQPHLDDAVLGIGELMALHPGGTCLTVCAGRPQTYPAIDQRPHDAACGFQPGDDPVLERRAEDAEAMRLLGWHEVWLDLLDTQYLVLDARPFDDTASALYALAEAWEAAGRPHEIVTVAGIAHPDHRWVRDLVTLFAKSARHPAPLSVIAWREPGYRSTFLAEAAALDRTQPWHSIHAVSWCGAKLEAIRCYESQLPALSALAIADALTQEEYGAWAG